MSSVSKKSIQFADESAKRIGQINIESKPNFYFDASQQSNSIDDAFVDSLVAGEHLTDDFLNTSVA